MNHRFSRPLRPFLPTRRAAIRLPLLVVLLLLMLTLPYLAFGAEGELDPTFGGDGVVITDLTSLDIARSVAVQGDGKILVAANPISWNFALLRYNSDGSLDSSFDSDGVVSPTIGAWRNTAEMVVQGNGKILVAGEIWSSRGLAFAVARYGSDGSLDSSFDSDGIVTTTLGMGTITASDMAVQADNKILVLGMDDPDSLSTGDTDVVLIRYESDGSLDSSLGGDGIVTTTLTLERASAMAIQADNKILVLGYTLNRLSDSHADSDFALLRYNSDGSLDSSFGSSGVVTTTVGNCADDARAIALQEDGKILVVGTASIGDSVCSSASMQRPFTLLRYSSDGTLDSSFGSSGVVTTTISPDGSQAADLAMQGDGKILVAGTAYFASSQPPFYDPYSSMVVARYNSDGTLDSSFNSDGLPPPLGSNAGASRIVVQADSKILVLGGTVTDDRDLNIALVRYEGSHIHRLYLPVTR